MSSAGWTNLLNLPPTLANRTDFLPSENLMDMYTRIQQFLDWYLLP